MGAAGRASSIARSPCSSKIGRNGQMTPALRFILGRSYDDLGNPAQAIVWYRRRLTVGGWEEETFYTRFRLGACLLQAGYAEEACGELWRAWGERPW